MLLDKKTKHPLLSLVDVQASIRSEEKAQSSGFGSKFTDA
jgi:hypothetical protein